MFTNQSLRLMNVCKMKKKNFFDRKENPAESKNIETGISEIERKLNFCSFDPKKPFSETNIYRQMIESKFQNQILELKFKFLFDH